MPVKTAHLVFLSFLLHLSVVIDAERMYDRFLHGGRWGDRRGNEAVQVR